MKIRIPLSLVALAFAGLFALPAMAGDGEKDRPTGDGKAKEADGCKETKDGDGCKEKKDCECCKGKKDGECAEGKEAPSDLEILALAAVEGTGDAAKKVLAAIPAASQAKVEAARKATLDRLARVHVAMTGLKKEFDEQCGKAKAGGAEVCANLKATYEKDMKGLHAKAKEQLAACAKVLGESIGEEKVKELSAECRKAGDLLGAATEKVKAAAALLKKECCEAEEDEDGEDDEDDCDDGACIEVEKDGMKKPVDGKAGEPKPSEKKPEEKKPESKDAK